MGLINIKEIKVYPSQYCVIIPVTGRSVYYQYYYTKWDGKTEDWKLIKNWTKEAYCGFMLPEIGTYIIAVAVSPEKKYTNPVMFSKVTVNIKKKHLLKSGVYVNSEWSEDLVNDFWNVRCGCNQLPLDHIKMIQYILKKMYCEHGAKQLVVSELNNVGGCSGHPTGTHTNTDIDLSYYLKSGVNHTQSHGWGDPDLIFTDDKVDETKFDYERVYTLWSLIRYHFPKSYIRTDQRIRDFIFKRKPVLKQINGDFPQKYRHNTHMHINLGVEILWT